MAGHETEQLVDYVASLRYEDIPDDAVRAAKNTIIDGVADYAFGYGFPWSQAVLRAALCMGEEAGLVPIPCHMRHRLLGE